MKVKSEDFFRILSAVINEERKKQKMTQIDLACKASLNRAYISEIERGKRNPTINVLLQISEALSISMSALMLRVEFILKIDKIPTSIGSE